MAFNSLALFYALGSLAMFCIVSGIYGSWDHFAHSTNPETGQGGVFPYGWEGVAMGAAIVVVSYAGFETTVCLSSEAIDAKRDIPRALFLSYVIAGTIYTTVAFFIAYLSPWLVSENDP